MRIRKISQIEPNMSKVIGINDTPNDKDVYSSNAVNEVINNKMIYSIKEKVIGKYEDGRPVYRLWIESVIPDSTGWKKIVETPNLSIDKLFVNDIKMYIDNRKRILPIPYVEVGYAVSVDIRPNDGIYIWTQTNGFKDKPIEILLEYTKTTD